MLTHPPITLFAANIWPRIRCTHGLCWVGFARLFHFLIIIIIIIIVFIKQLTERNHNNSCHAGQNTLARRSEQQGLARANAATNVAKQSRQPRPAVTSQVFTKWRHLSTYLINRPILLIYRPRKDERLSWPSWLACSGRFTHIMVTRRLQAERRTGSVHRRKTGVLPTVLRNQPFMIGMNQWHRSALRHQLLPLGLQHSAFCHPNQPQWPQIHAINTGRNVGLKVCSIPKIVKDRSKIDCCFGSTAQIRRT